MQSPSSRRAWIEIKMPLIWAVRCLVALLAEGVDRNWAQQTTSFDEEVALLAEGVDRNTTIINVLLNCPRRPPRGGRG